MSLLKNRTKSYYYARPIEGEIKIDSNGRYTLTKTLSYSLKKEIPLVRVSFDLDGKLFEYGEDGKKIITFVTETASLPEDSVFWIDKELDTPPNYKLDELRTGHRYMRLILKQI